jgi:hypothetical protein
MKTLEATGKELMIGPKACLIETLIACRICAFPPNVIMYYSFWRSSPILKVISFVISHCITHCPCPLSTKVPIKIGKTCFYILNAIQSPVPIDG